MRTTPTRPRTSRRLNSDEDGFLAAGAWIIPVGVLGALVGSFLNVVIFRLPRGLSVSSPAWSFCPRCEKRLLPWHNVPIFGWLFLRGRCHFCEQPIPVVYPVVECLTALTFVITWDACFIGRADVAAGAEPVHWAYAASLIVMYAGLIATAGMDIESYSLDIRVPLFTLAVSAILRGLQGLAEPHQIGNNSLPPGLTCVALAGGAGWLLGWPLTRHLARRPTDEDATGNSESAPLGQGGDSAGRETTATNPDGSVTAPCQAAVPLESAPASFQPLPVILLAAALLGLVVWVAAAPQWPAQLVTFNAGQVRGFVAVSIILIVMILASMVARDADDEIVTTLERERVSARAIALRELICLVPAVAAGIGVFALLRGKEWLGLEWAALLRQFMGTASSLTGATAGFVGASQALADAAIAAALGWAVRIGGTLAFGKEAFGTGDIYLMAAIAAAGGWFMMLIAFFASALLALVGVIATSMHKSARAIPFGPWLGLGALAALYLERPLTGWFGPAGGMIWGWLTGQNRIGTW